MINKDNLIEQKKKFATDLMQAMEKKDENMVLQVFNDYAESVQKSIIQTAEELSQTTEVAVLASRGIRQLTPVEQKFYQKFAEALSSSDPKQALANPELTIPQTVIDSVIEDVKAEHPLLASIDFKNTHGAIRWIFSDGSTQMATWDKITSKIKTEASRTIHTIDLGFSKLTAFIPVSKDIIKLAPNYMDAYVREILAEAIYIGCEYGIVKGDGNNKPIGMMRNLKGAVTEGVYSAKEKVALNSFGVTDYCGIVSLLSKRDDETSRKVSRVALYVNPTDYINKVIPATTVLGTDGTYRNNIFPFPTDVYPTEVLDEGEAIMGLPKRYLMCVSGAGNPETDYSDQFDYLNDNRTYISRMYGTGQPKDNTSFVYLDISNLKPLELSVTLKNATEEE